MLQRLYCVFLFWMILPQFCAQVVSHFRNETKLLIFVDIQN